MRRILCGLTALGCLLLTGCSGLPYAREMGDMALLRTMGVDAAEGELTVTVSTGPRPRGLQGEGEAALTLSAAGTSLSGALLALQERSGSYLFFGYVDQLLVGEELARQGAEPVLDYFARDVELGLGAQVWLVRTGTAEDAVRSGGGQGVESRLATLQTDGEMGLSAAPRTAGEIFSDLLEWGSAYVPALTMEGQGEERSLRQSGYGVLKGGRLAGFLDGEAAAGLELLAGQASADVLEAEVAGQRVALLVSGGGTSCVFEAEGRRLRVTCQVTARLAEYRETLDRDDLREAAEQVERRESDRVRAALAALGRWEADCTGLAARAALARPGRRPEKWDVCWEVQVELWS